MYNCHSSPPLTFLHIDITIRRQMSGVKQVVNHYDLSLLQRSCRSCCLSGSKNQLTTAYTVVYTATTTTSNVNMGECHLIQFSLLMYSWLFGEECLGSMTIFHSPLNFEKKIMKYTLSNMSILCCIISRVRRTHKNGSHLVTNIKL